MSFRQIPSQHTPLWWCSSNSLPCQNLGIPGNFGCVLFVFTPALKTAPSATFLHKGWIIWNVIDVKIFLFCLKDVDPKGLRRVQALSGMGRGNWVGQSSVRLSGEEWGMLSKIEGRKCPRRAGEMAIGFIQWTGTKTFCKGFQLILCEKLRVSI